MATEIVTENFPGNVVPFPGPGWRLSPFQLWERVDPIDDAVHAILRGFGDLTISANDAATVDEALNLRRRIAALLVELESVESICMRRATALTNR